MNTSGQYCDFPKAKLAAGFVILPERSLMDIFYARDNTKKIAQDILCELGREDQTMNKKGTDLETFRFKNAAVEYVRDHIGRFMERLLGCGGYKSVSVQQNGSECRYLLKGSIVTNGLEVHLLAYDMKCPRRKEAISSNQEENPDQDLASNMDAEMEIEGGFTAVSSLDTDAKDELEDEIASGAATVVAQSTFAVAAQDSSQAESASQAASTTYAINWRQKSKILDNLEVVLDKPEDRAQLTDAIILGADPGEVNPLVVAKLDPRQPNKRHIVKITRKMHYVPYARFRQALETRKAEAGIDKAESGIPTFSRATLSQYFDYILQPASSISTTTTSSATSTSTSNSQTILSKLLTFYRSPWVLKKSWDLKKAQRSLIDLSIKAILRLAEGSEGRKREDGERKVILCIGLANFNSQTGLPSKHSLLERQLVLKASDIER